MVHTGFFSEEFELIIIFLITYYTNTKGEWYFVEMHFHEEGHKCDPCTRLITGSN